MKALRKGAGIWVSFVPNFGSRRKSPLGSPLEFGGEDICDPPEREGRSGDETDSLCLKSRGEVKICNYPTCFPGGSGL